VIKACLVQSWCRLSGNWSVKIPDLTTSWCSISQTVQTNAFVYNGGFPLCAAINLLCSSLQSHAVRYTVNWLLFTSIWIYSHPTGCCFWFVHLPVLWTIFKCASWVICLVAALAASQWANLCLHSSCVRRIAVLDVTPVDLVVFDPLSPGRGSSVSMMCWLWIGEEVDNERKWEALWTI